MNEHNIIEIKSGVEYRVCVDDPKNLCDENKFFYPVYRKSAKLIKEIISHFSDKENDFFEADYHNNIIMYCAERGSGKSSAMFSFANALARSQENGDYSDSLSKLFDENVKNYNFSVLNPIDPTMISERDLFMRIILSKMFSQLREQWEDDMKFRDSYPSGNLQADKIQHAKIIKQFMKCYRYLDVIYQKGGKFDCDDSLEDLTELGDSGRFKDEFRHLVKDYLYEMINKVPTDNDVMIIPIDDADLNSKMAFNIVEDIRKYCIIPNVIILMAVNIDQIHYVLEQHFAIDFKTLMDVSRADSEEIKTVDMQECHSMAMRYVDKILPAAHQIHLPAVDDFIRNSSSTLTVKYFSQNKNDENKILPAAHQIRLPAVDDFIRNSGSTLIVQYVPQNKNDENLNILDFNKINGSKEKVTDYQELLLRLIYNKTGIALTKPKSYLHNFLPKTMRGLSHFLAYMCNLPDLNDELGVTEIYELIMDTSGNREKEIGITLSKAKEELRKRIDNLEAFKQYFLKNWCTVRLSKKHCDAINILEKTADGLKISAASKLIDELHPNINTSLGDNFDPPLSPTSYAFIMKKIHKMSSQAHVEHNPSRVYMLAYAMKLYFMLFFSRLLLTCVRMGDFDSLLKYVNLEAWVPFNGKFTEHTEDMMFGRFTIDYNIVKKLVPPAEMKEYFNKYIFISENGKNSRYISNVPLLINKAERSGDNKSEVKLVYDYGTMLLYCACGYTENPFADKGSKNDYKVRNALFALLTSFDLQRHAEKFGIMRSYSSDSTKDSLNNILKGLYNIDYLPIPWMEITKDHSDNHGVKALQMANREIAIQLVGKWQETLNEECKKIAVDESLLNYKLDDVEYFQNMVSNLYAIKSGIMTIKPTFDYFQKICDALESPKSMSVSKKLSEKWKKIYDSVKNYEPQTFIDSEGTRKQDYAVNEAKNIVRNFINWRDYISNKTLIFSIMKK